MIFKPKFGQSNYKYISIDNFIEIYKKDNPNEDFNALKVSLLHFKQLKTNGEKCDCGNPIWIIGSSISGKGCFCCITGESEASGDYEIK